MELKGENLWSISDDFLFVACGLLVSAAHAGTSVYITWNKYYLLNIRFKDRKDTSRKKITVMRIPLPILGGNYIKSVHTLRYNTMLLMSDGEVYFFRSFKAMNLIKCLSGVRCLAVLDDGFSVIREEDQRLLLQMYHDIPSSENVESTLQYTFDITFDDKNIFQCEWQNDNYTLTTLKVTEDKKQFVQNLFGLKEVQPHYVHIFSIAGHVFVLTLNITGLSESSHQDYHIELLCVYASHVRYIRLLPTENLCLVFLSTGSVDICFVDENTQELYFKDEKLHHCATKNYLCGTLESRDASAIYYFKKHIISNTAKLDIEDSLKYNDFTFDKIMTETELLYGLNCYDVLNSSTKMAINPRYFAIRNAFF
ncbi:uncharacterized protein LOC108024369 isoform X17 [Drosophila biarmipes]|uniref:uncharacterized protein LOC108024369 isoform X15 n=1 Tax=Drosophila biarmipes TaxID=125945 RepID=UPI0021CCE1F6|nr:uncharacterized protein LOC108024369 isoform X15 [Drosophila biarmipes]XP_050746065.1 uncharacterized protein LOC108024369 isoform X16 [Drosophila biarmipes]XP_050746066.1 uncharacterized protein LOC108024369 isoform X17 [Drosophila biarmipes]